MAALCTCSFCRTQLPKCNDRLAVPDAALAIWRAFAREGAFNRILHPYRMRADRIMVVMNSFLTLVCFAIAPARET